MKQLTIKILEEYLKNNYINCKDEQGLFMKLVEEIGEVAEALNIKNGRKSKDDNINLGKELVDVIHYVVAIAAINNIDLEKEIVEKDKQASLKYHHEYSLIDYLDD